MSIAVANITKRFGKFVALNDVSLEIPTGSLVALLGPSGSGKTTLLRIIAGLEMPDAGSVRYEERDVTAKPVRKRKVGFVFQHYALFRHMTVFENVAFGLRLRKWPADQVKARVEELLRLIRLEGYGQRYPSQLSGGQRQRVALARALAVEPRVLLLDEPFGALDAKVRQELRQWLRRFHDQIGVTSVFVTHDQEEAFEVADQVVVMRGGRIEQKGTPQEVFEHPANSFVMDFLGTVNVFHGRVHEGRAHLGSLEIPCPGSDGSGPAVIYVRPHELEVERSPNGHAALAAEVLHVNPAGAVARVQLQVSDGTTLTAEVSSERQAELALRSGDQVHVFPRRVRVFSPQGKPLAPDYVI